MDIRNDRNVKIHASRVPREAKEYIKAFWQTAIIVAVIIVVLNYASPDSLIVRLLYGRIGSEKGVIYGAIGIAFCVIVCVAFTKPGGIRLFFRKKVAFGRRSMVQTFYKFSSAFLIASVTTAITTSSFHDSKEWFLFAILAAFIGYIFSLEIQRGTGNIIRNVKIKKS